MPPEIQEGEVGSYTLGVAHSIRIFVFLYNKRPPSPLWKYGKFLIHFIMQNTPRHFYFGFPFAHRYFLLYSPAIPSLEVHEC